MFLAWREFRRGKSKKLDIQEFEFNLEDNIFQLHAELINKTYQHSSYTSFYVTDPKLRHIHKACVRDRVLHHAVFRVLYLIFDKSFIFDSYSCRIGKGTHRAVRRLKSFCDKLSANDSRSISILKCDVRKFFDSVDQTILLDIIGRKVKNDGVIWLIEKIVKSFETGNGRGLPIGNVTSQLFANIYLNELDQFIKHELRIRYYLRYCDDFVILSREKERLLGLVNRISNFLHDQLKLVIHPDKIFIRKYRQGIDFLGSVIRPYCVTLRTKTTKRMLKRIKEQNLSSYSGILKHCNGFKIKRAVEAKMGLNI